MIDPRFLPPHPSAPDEPEELGELSDDAIAGPFRILQRVRGHRYSLDDVLTAYVAAQAAKDATRCLDLGTGIGSVLLMLAYKLAHARFAAVEAQRNSFALLTRNVARNGLDARVEAVHGDLRAVVGMAPLDGPFDLITGTPPYVPPGRATPSSDAQKAFARQELRGGVEAYLEAGSRVLSTRGRVVVCADARSPERVERAAAALGLCVVARCEVVAREGSKGPLFSVFTLSRQGDHATNTTITRWVARTHDGARSEAYRALRAFFAMPARDDEAPSP
jgi:tRNA1(Val) A37 N6-methylase TrmN6